MVMLLFYLIAYSVVIIELWYVYEDVYQIPFDKQIGLRGYSGMIKRQGAFIQNRELFWFLVLRDVFSRLIEFILGIIVLLIKGTEQCIGMEFSDAFAIPILLSMMYVVIQTTIGFIVLPFYLVGMLLFHLIFLNKLWEEMNLFIYAEKATLSFCVTRTCDLLTTRNENPERAPAPPVHVAVRTPGVALQNVGKGPGVMTTS